MLLRAYPESGSSSGAVVIEARLLAEHLPQDACQRLLDELAVLEKSGASRPQLHHQQLLYYQDSTSHLAQEAARKAWKALPVSVSSSAAKRSISSAAGGTYSSSQKAAKKVKLSSAEAAGGGEGESMDTFSVAHIARKKSGGNLISGTYFYPLFISSVYGCLLFQVFTYLQLEYGLTDTQAKNPLVHPRPIFLRSARKSGTFW